MRWISNKTVKIGGIYSSLEEAFEFCWSSFAGEHNTLVKSTRRNVELNKFGCGTPWLPDILCKQRFMSSVWDFCHWVADVPPLETSPAAKSEEKRLFSSRLTFVKQLGWMLEPLSLEFGRFPIAPTILLTKFMILSGEFCPSAITAYHKATQQNKQLSHTTLRYSRMSRALECGRW